MWKYSKVRFYILNLIWNYKFWIFSEKIYQNHSFQVNEELDMNKTNPEGRVGYKKRTINQRRFIGYMFEGKMYLDNPGVKEFVDKETSRRWIEKGFIK